MLNYYENTLIKNSKLPAEWQSQVALDELLEFLQQNWEQRSIFYKDGQVTSKQQFLDFGGQKSIRTKDYVGTIVFKGQQLNIFPKVFKTEKDDTDTDELDLKMLMHNLVKWVEYSSKFDYPYISVSADLENSNNLQELFISLYVRYVKNALDRGLFFRYEEQDNDERSIKGRFNIKDYFVRKYPNGTLDKFRCEYSTFEFDNLLNRIIKCTCKYIMNLTNSKNQKIIRNILNKLGEVSDVRCAPNDCDKIVLSKMNDNYRIILSMSKMFLLNKASNYDIDTQESFCFLFPTDILFEGFVGGFMQSILKGSAKVRLQESEDYLFDSITIDDKEYKNSFVMRHDILVEHKEKGLFILDTKYKELSRFKYNQNKERNILNEANENDMRQVFTYALIRGLNKVYLLYPQYSMEDLDTKAVGKKTLHYEGANYKIDIYFLRIPFVFGIDDDKIMENLKQVLLEIFE